MNPFYLAGWGVSFLVMSSLLFIKWIQVRKEEDLKQQNERLKEAVEFYRNKAE
ncbi:hypothetical protein V1502_11490 [Bacillus sp. SCS-153A]|uniref:hypothetical protein n=1 Tax=Rossellomorea sedimentorum TaxID=3115294 RepID=UPI0039065088